jgi:hypothetical protein
MTANVDHNQLWRVFGDVLRTRENWERLAEVFHPDAVLEYPQSGERFRGLANIRAQFENYAGLEVGSSEVEEVIGGTTYVLTPSYTVVGVEGSGDRGVALVRARYPDGLLWWVVNLYEVREGLIARSRAFFGPEFEAPEWRAPYREAP